MSETIAKPQGFLTVDRIVNATGAVGMLVLGIFATSWSNKWNNFEQQAIRMEHVPEKVDKILEKVDDISKSDNLQNYRLDNLEKAPRK
jgi:hypothetical protein